MSAADRLAAFIEREKSGDDSDWQYDPRPDIETLLAALSRVEQERDEALRALNGMLEMHCCDCTFCEDAAAAVGREDDA